jgi:secreted PhoX family phosphatase
MANLGRRDFLRRAALASGVLLAPSLTGLISCGELQDQRKPRRGYGKLYACADVNGIISLPRHFHAMLISTAGDSMIGGVVPNACDGMGAFAAGGNLVRLVRNHEIRDTPEYGTRPFGPNPYDSRGPGGTTTVELQLEADGRPQLVRQFASLTGTAVNCAGGPTPWGSWISCEETVDGTDAGWDKNHGYTFEVPASSNSVVTPVPLKQMGRFIHEAVAVDPETGYVYLTEDNTPAGFYRFVPKTPGHLQDGGNLEILAIDGRRQYDTTTNQRLFAPMKVRWLPIPHPDSDAGTLDSHFVFNQGFEQGAAQFVRLEGCWYGDRSIFLNSTIGGNAQLGQVWQYRPDRQELQLIFESPSSRVLENPDNITVSPRGGIVLCEDGPGIDHVRGLTRSGEIFDFAKNNLNASEWAGACFSPQGRTLFVNLWGSGRPLQLPSGIKGMTFAVWGPWESGAL